MRSSRRLVEAGFLDVVEEEVESPDGEVLTRYTVRHPGAVAVVPVDGDDVVMVRQYRAAARRALLEVPAGKREPDEAPEETAARELEEEVGLVPGRLVKLAGFYNSPGFTDEYTHVYLADGLTVSPGGREGLRAEERHMEVVRVALDDVDGLVAAGEVVDAKTIVGLALARRHR